MELYNRPNNFMLDTTEKTITGQFENLNFGLGSAKNSN